MDRNTTSIQGRDDRPDPDGPRQTGRIVRLIDGRGFGFVEVTNSPGTEVFLHASAFEIPAEFASLSVGDQITFVEGQTTKGPRAFYAQLA